jgi:hypothetical protein
MTPSAIFKVTTGALVAVSLACGETERNEPAPFPVQSGSHSGGQPTGGGTGAAQGGSAAVSAGQAGAASGSAGAEGSDVAAVPKPTPVTQPITQVVKSDGCGKLYTGPMGAEPNTLQTSGVKAADCADQFGGKPVCGPWKAARTYNLYLPQNYDHQKPYPLVIQAPGCGGTGASVPAINQNVENTAIRVGVAPGPKSLGHATNPDQGCFDTHEGDDSIDWVMYEQLYDQLNAKLCFDRNRLFVGGHSSGAWFANELGCRYAGDTLRPVRGVLPNEGGLPTEPRYVPTCTSTPLAGIWVHQVNNLTTPFTSAKVAIERAMSLNQCANGNAFDTAPAASFPIGGGRPDDTCKRISGCDPLYPIVVCPLPGNRQSGNDETVNPAWSTFIKLFQTAPFLTQ